MLTQHNLDQLTLSLQIILTILFNLLQGVTFAKFTHIRVSSARGIQVYKLNVTW